MEIGIKHWFSVLSLAVLAHMYAVLNVNLTGYSAESEHPFEQYTIDLTTLALPPKQVKLEPFIPAPPKETRPPAKPPAPEIMQAKPEPKPEPKPKPKPKPEAATPKVKQPKVVTPEFERPVENPFVTPAEPPSRQAPEQAPQPAPRQVPGDIPSSKGTPAAAPRPGTQTGEPGYYRLILDRLERLKKYPSRARRRGDQGTVVLSFTLNRDGSLKHYEITRSSGSKALDIEVKKLIRRATPFPAIPKNISSDTLEVSVPISFALN